MRSGLATVAVLVMIGLAGCGGDDTADESNEADAVTSPSAPVEPTSLIVRGTIEVPVHVQSVMREKRPTVGITPCRADDGYDDIEPGAQVTVRNADGATVALGKLEEGVLAGEDGALLLTADCSFPFEVGDVPTGGEFYSIEVSHRGAVSYSEDEMSGPVTLTLGD